MIRKVKDKIWVMGSWDHGLLDLLLVIGIPFDYWNMVSFVFFPFRFFLHLFSLVIVLILID